MPTSAASRRANGTSVSGATGRARMITSRPSSASKYSGRRSSRRCPGWRASTSASISAHAGSSVSPPTSGSDRSTSKSPYASRRTCSRISWITRRRSSTSSPRSANSRARASKNDRSWWKTTHRRSSRSRIAAAMVSPNRRLASREGLRTATSRSDWLPARSSRASRRWMLGKSAGSRARKEESRRRREAPSTASRPSTIVITTMATARRSTKVASRSPKLMRPPVPGSRAGGRRHRRWLRSRRARTSARRPGSGTRPGTAAVGEPEPDPAHPRRPGPRRGAWPR